MTALALVFTLACIGVSEAVYLVRKRIESEAPVCPIGEGCATVLSSKYSKIFLVPNDILGLLAYIVIAVIAGFLVVGVAPIGLWTVVIKILIGIASIMSIFFYISAVENNPCLVFLVFDVGVYNLVDGAYNIT